MLRPRPVTAYMALLAPRLDAPRSAHVVRPLPSGESFSRSIGAIARYRQIDRRDGLPQERRDSASARRFFRHLLAHLGGEPGTIVTDKLGSFAVARRKLLPDAAQDTRRYANNRAGVSHQRTRIRERGMRRSRSITQAQRFVGVHAAVSNLFNLGRHPVAAGHQRTLRQATFASKDLAVAV
jgi:putative transposase